jgi:hypothetical protein
MLTMEHTISLFGFPNFGTEDDNGLERDFPNVWMSLTPFDITHLNTLIQNQYLYHGPEAAVALSV